MPTSHFKQIPDIITAILKVNPKSIFEVGIGCGKYGILAREYLEVWDHYFEPWGANRIKMDGIDVHPLYQDSPGWAAYDVITIGDIRDELHKLQQYDMILAVDVMEHFTKREALDLLDAFLKKASAVVIGMPAQFFHTEVVWENEHEVHKCALTPRDLRKVTGNVEIIRHDDSLVAILRR